MGLLGRRGLLGKLSRMHPLLRFESIGSGAPKFAARMIPRVPLAVGSRWHPGRERLPRINLERAPLWGALSRLIRRRPTLPGPCGPSTIGAERLNCSVRNGKRCIPLAMTTGNCERFGGRRSRAHPQNSIAVAMFSKSRPRIISTGLLNALLRLHIPPINLVVSQDPYSLKGMGELISRWASRLDAFSGYPIQT